MGENVVKLGTSNDAYDLGGLMTDQELADFKRIVAHPATVGYILFDPDAEVLESKNISENNAAALANVFDICGDLSDSLGQKHHVGTVFEGREMEITCRRLQEARLVVFRSKVMRTGE